MNIYVGFTLTRRHASYRILTRSLTYTHMKTKHLELCSALARRQCHSVESMAKWMAMAMAMSTSTSNCICICISICMLSIPLHINTLIVSIDHLAWGLRFFRFLRVTTSLWWGDFWPILGEMCGHLLAYKDTQLCVSNSRLFHFQVCPRDRLIKYACGLRMSMGCG